MQQHCFMKMALDIHDPHNETATDHYCRNQILNKVKETLFRFGKSG
jgi:hypothetical protein